MIEHDIEETLLIKDGCFVCNIVKKKMEERFLWFGLENYHEIGTLEKLVSNPFICERHKKELSNVGDRLSVTFEFVVKKDMEFFESLLSFNAKKFKKTLKGNSFNECMFCLEEENYERFIIEKFIKMLEKDDIKQLYEKSDGLCRKHLMKCLSIIGKKDETAEFLIDDTINRLFEIEKSFDMFFHKSDYRFSSEKKGKEQTTWIDALNFYSNNKN